MGRPGKIFVYYISIVLVFIGLVYITPEDISGVLSPGSSKVANTNSKLLAEEDSHIFYLFSLNRTALQKVLPILCS